MNKFEQAHVVGEGDGPGGSPCGRGQGGWGSCKQPMASWFVVTWGPLHGQID